MAYVPISTGKQLSIRIDVASGIDRILREICAERIIGDGGPCPVVRPECANLTDRYFPSIMLLIGRRKDLDRLCYESHGQMRKKYPDCRIELLRVEKATGLY